MAKIAELAVSYIASCNRKEGDTLSALKLAGDWLLAAQSAKGRGYAHSYSMISGWQRPYPETTGYIIPTMIDLGKYTEEQKYKESAIDSADWLVGIQQKDGSFLDLSGTKQVFDTAQVIEGMIAVYMLTGDRSFLNAAIKAANFIVGSQDESGAWTKFSYNNIPHTYYSKVSAVLFKLGSIIKEKKYRDSAHANINWVISQQRENGYFNFMSFTGWEAPYLHTIVYVLEGLLDSYSISEDPVLYERTKRTIEAMIGINGKGSDMLDAQYDEDWKSHKNEKCLTGLAQWARVLIDMCEISKDVRYYKIAKNVVDYLKMKQVRSGTRNIRGALPGSIPIWGSYFRFSFNNWTVKYFIDAVLRMERIKDIYGR